jgi:hypothetical protein
MLGFADPLRERGLDLGDRIAPARHAASRVIWSSWFILAVAGTAIVRLTLRKHETLGVDA